MGGMIMS